MSLLSDGNIRLRAIEPQDLELIYTIENNTELWGCSETNVPYSRYAVKQFLSDNNNDIYSDRQVRLVVERVYDGKAIGFADLVNFSPRHMRAEIGIVVFPDYRNKGFGKKTLSLLENYAFNHLLIHTLFAIIAESNYAAVNLFRSAGFDFRVLLDDWLAKSEGFENAWMCQKILRKYTKN